MLEGSGIWEQADLEAHDYGLLCAYTHPDCDGPALADHRLVRVGVLLRRPLPRHVQADPGPRSGQGAPGPPAAVHAARPRHPRAGTGESGGGRAEGPVGADGAVDVRGLAPPLLGRHRAPAQRVDVELSNINEGRIANPVEYIEMRRRSAARPGRPDSWSTRPPRCPPRSAGTRPLRVPHGDVLRRRPPAQRPVLLPTRGRGRGREQQRRARAGEVLRLHHAGGRRHRQRRPHLAAAPVRAPRWTEVPAVALEKGLTPGEVAAAVAAYTRGLPGLAVRRPRMAHALQPVHEQGRAVRLALAAEGGPGTSAAHIGALLASAAQERLRAYSHVPYQKVGPSRIPDLYMPFEPSSAPPGPGPRQPRRLVPPDGHPPGGGLGRGQARRVRPRPVLRRPGPGRHPRGPRPQRAVARLGDVRRRLPPAVYGHRRDLAAARPTMACRSACRSRANPPSSPATPWNAG